ncbi:unnamed protein product [Rhizophagus irregularis]|nr:unnamed protein product [Rhizophagus irregularis]
MSSESPNKRVCSIGLCYLCQACLHCNKDCSYTPCKCKEERRQQTPLCKKGKKRKCYSRVYCIIIIVKNTLIQKINELKRMNDYYGYESNFSEKFNFSLCTGKFYRIGRQNEKTQGVSTNQFSLPKITHDNSLENGLESADQNITTILLDNTLEFTNNLTRENSLTSPNSFFENNDDISPELLTSEVEEIEEIEINFKLVIKVADGKCNAAKWETILANDCQKFKSKLDQLIQEQFEDQVVFREDYKSFVNFGKNEKRSKKTRLRDSNDQAEFHKILWNYIQNDQQGGHPQIRPVQF